MKLATTIGEFYPYADGDPVRAVRAYAGTGFRYLDYSFYDALRPGGPFLTGEWRREVAAAGEAAADLGFTFVQAHAPDYNPMDPSADHETGLQAVIHSIHACGMLGIRNIVVHSGFSDHVRYPEGKAAYFAKNREFYRALFPAMEMYGVNVLIENSSHGNMQGKYFPITGQDMVDLIRAVDHPLLHACWDTGHANMEPLSQYQEIKVLGPELRALHVQDNFGVWDEHIMPFSGTMNIDSLMQGLLETGYNGYFTFEADHVLCPARSWPHSRKEEPLPMPPRLQSPSLELRQQASALQYQTGKYILEQYGCFEE